MGQNLGPLNISSSYQALVQISGSQITDGTGSLISSLDITATSASYALNAGSALSATTAVSASFATTASYALNAAATVDTGSLLTTASISNAQITFTKGDASTFNITVNNVVNADSASVATTATSASHALVADSATTAGSATTATSASHAVNADSAISASFATTASFALNAGDPFPYTGNVGITGDINLTGSYNRLSGSFSGSVIDNITDTYTVTAAIEHVITLTQAQYNAISASADPNTLYYITDAASFATSASYALSASQAENANTAITASHALIADFAASATSASFATTALLATSASHANNADTATSASHAVNADSALSATSASHALIADDLVTGANINITSITASGATFTNLTATSASIGHLTTVSGSAVIIGDAYIIVNSSNATRYAGLAVYESGSVPATTASWNFDSLTNDWFYEYTGSDPTNFGVAMFGPEYSVKGTPSYPTNNRLVKGDGGHHLNDSSITDDGSTVSMTAELDVTGGVSASAGFLGNLTGNASTATSASHAVASDTAISASHAVNADSAITASYVLNAVSASYSDTSVSASHALVADTATTASYVASTVSASYAATATSASHAVNADNAIVAGTVTISEDVSAANYDMVYEIATDTLGRDSAGDFAYNPDTNTLTVTNVSGNASTATSASFASTVADGISLNDPVINGQMYGNVQSLSITSLTASLDCSLANFFTLTLVDGVDTHLTATNPTGGQTVNVQITNGAAGTGTMSFNTSIFKFPGGTATTGSAGASAIDVVSFVCFDDATLLANYIENLS